jgi:hypothetical protein
MKQYTYPLKLTLHLQCSFELKITSMSSSNYKKKKKKKIQCTPHDKNIIKKNKSKIKTTI